MPCTQTVLVKNTDTPSVVPLIKLYGSGTGTRRMFISDNPESIFPSDFTNAGTSYLTLWHDSVSQTSVKYRLFFWHLNSTLSPIKIGVTLGNASTTDTISVSNVKTSVYNGPYFQAGGRCAAQALVGSTLDSGSSVSAASNSITVIREWVVAPKQLVGGIIEFDLSNATNASSALKYKLRTIASKTSTGNLTLHQGAPCAPHDQHPRGAWGYSDLTEFSDAAKTQPVSYAAGSGNYSVALGNGVNDLVFPAGSSYDASNAFANKALYGAIYSTTLKLTNNTGASKTIRISVVGRGGSFAGAASVNGVTVGIPTILAQTSGATTQDGVIIHEVTVSQGAIVNVPLKMTTAGGGSTVVAILFQTV
ncbi:hypothetical protein PAECIP111893_01486 [Paenibacillus plantiphilus]|uniref:Uncharacterized protein n=1 Tax=Paenibacillus plantiphilus TaxID=2905650 RepID=A0ABN8GCW7_9BACL|nr:hypothetical protein [Paenibacillus plantiphilus]CAH1200598.1 hypothetical protein PAECIP111893_01486 [Paenibacillus plantiphilus]